MHRQPHPLILLPVFIAAAFCQAPEAGITESLSYSINWPSGLSLGEGQITTRKTAVGWEYQMVLQASIPGFPVRDQYTSRVTPNGCSVEFEKESQHGERKADEKSVFDQDRKVLVRQTSGGGKSELPITVCAKDALAFLNFVRKEIGQGRLPGAQTVYFGAAYQVKFQYAGAQYLTAGESRVEADRLTVMIKGPASEVSFEIFLARDEARTPLLVKVPLSMGTFAMELVR